MARHFESGYGTERAATPFAIDGAPTLAVDQ
jgi:hypothetical protein